MASLELVSKPSAELEALGEPELIEETREMVTRFTTRFGAIFRRVQDERGIVTWYRERP